MLLHSLTSEYNNTLQAKWSSILVLPKNYICKYNFLAKPFFGKYLPKTYERLCKKMRNRVNEFGIHPGYFLLASPNISCL